MNSSIQDLIQQAQHIVVLQADNPDGDSLGSSFALEEMLGEMGKQVSLVCGVDMPGYLHYLTGWSRVQKDVPSSFDLSIIVDANTETLFTSLERSGQFSWIKSKPCIVIDHHQASEGLEFCSLKIINSEAVATSEMLYDLAVEHKWPLNLEACKMMAVSIMSDSVGLMSDATTSHTIHIVADLVDRGVSLSALDDARRELMRKEPVLLPYKGKLLQRIEYDNTGRIATVIIPQDELDKYSPLYNPSMLVIDEMRMIVGVDIAIAFKTYNDGKITAKIRCNYGQGIAADLAKEFGGGGHAYAAGFKITDGRDFATIKSDTIKKAQELLK